MVLGPVCSDTEWFSAYGHKAWGQVEKLAAPDSVKRAVMGSMAFDAEHHQIAGLLMADARVGAMVHLEDISPRTERASPVGTLFGL